MQQYTELRHKAEQQLQTTSDRPDADDFEDMRALLHELQIHQIELTLQNEELLRTQAELETSRQGYIELYDFAPLGYFTLEPDGTIRSINLTAARQLGREREALRGIRLYEFVHQDDRDSFFIHLRKTFENRERRRCELRFITQDGRLLYGQVESIMAPEQNTNTAVTTCCHTILIDISERKRLEDQIHADLHIKTSLLQEVHHRTRNNIQLIQCLLRSQLTFIHDERTAHTLEKLAHRLQSMSLIHQKIHRADLTHIMLQDYIRELSLDVRSYFLLDHITLSFAFDAPPSLMTIDPAIPFGMLLNEILSNAFQHAFSDRREGEVLIGLHTDAEGERELSVRDNGVGLPENFDERSPQTLGGQLMNILAQQLRGTLEFHRKNPGTEVVARFKEPEYKQRL